MYTFGRLLLQAVERHGTEIIGMELPEPECVQCIVTTGKCFSLGSSEHTGDGRRE